MQRNIVHIMWLLLVGLELGLGSGFELG